MARMDGNGAMLKIILAVVGVAVTVVIASLAFARDWGDTAKAVKMIESDVARVEDDIDKKYTEHRVWDTKQDSRLDGVEADVGVLKERAMKTETNQKNIMSALTEQKEATQKVNDKLDRILQRLPSRGGGDRGPE